jgi:hypothetical protein
MILLVEDDPDDEDLALRALAKNNIGARSSLLTTASHKTKAVAEVFEEHPKVRFHFTPTYSS